MKLSRGHSLQEHGKAAHQPSGGDSAKRFIFGEAKLVDTVRVEARTGANAVNATRFDLTEVREQARQEQVRATDEPSRGGEELRIRELVR
jgi:hypothetical protein